MRGAAAWLVLGACSFSTHPLGNGPDAPAGSADAPMVDGTPAPSGKHKVQLTFLNASRAEDLLDFPVLVVLDSTRIAYASSPAGANLRFTDPDTTQLAYEIESWDPAGRSFVWVRVPKIDRSSDTDFITMHYGDPALTDAQMPAQVWANADAVWHLTQDPGAHGVGDIKDSSGHRDGTATLATASADLVDAKIGKGFRMNGAGGGFEAVAASEAVYTWSAWLKGDAVPNNTANHEPICDGDTNFNFAWDHLTPAYAGASAQRDATQWHSAQMTGWQAATWYLVATTYDGSRMCLYVDAVQKTCVTSTSPLAPNGNFQIGDATSAATTFAGYIDEVRVYPFARTATWLDADHASQTDTLIAYGQPVPE